MENKILKCENGPEGYYYTPNKINMAIDLDNNIRLVFKKKSIRIGGAWHGIIIKFRYNPEDNKIISLYQKILL